MCIYAVMFVSEWVGVCNLNVRINTCLFVHILILCLPLYLPVTMIIYAYQLTNHCMGGGKELNSYASLSFSAFATYDTYLLPRP